MLEFNSIPKPKLDVHLAHTNSAYNISFQDAEKLAVYLKNLGVELTEIVAVSSQGAEYEKKWVVDNGFSISDPMYIKATTKVNNTVVMDHTVAVLAANIQRDPRWFFERLMEEHGIVQPQLAFYYIQFTGVNEAINKLF